MLDVPKNSLCEKVVKQTAGMRVRLLMAFALTLLLMSCGAPDPVKTTLSALGEAQKDFNGRQVIVSGTLRTYDSPRHYWIENDALDRVALTGEIDLASLVGETVTVRGMFQYDAESGRRIEVDELAIVE